MSYGMQIVGPQYDLHISYFCAACGVDKETPFRRPRGSNEDAILNSMFTATCIMDQVLMMLGGIRTEFSNQFLAGVVGHALLVLTFQMERGGSIDWEQRLSKRNHMQTDKWHLIGYAILVADCSLELGFLQSVPKRDPTFIKGGGYTACDETVLKEIGEETELMSQLGKKIAFMRCISSALIILCYHKSHDFAYLANAVQAEDDNDAPKKMIELQKTKDAEMAPLGIVENGTQLSRNVNDEN